MLKNCKSKKQQDTLEYLSLEMLALGLKRKQIDRIIADSLSGMEWKDLSEAEKTRVFFSLRKRISFLKKLLISLSCTDACRL